MQGWLSRCVSNVRAPPSLTVSALHLPVVSSLDEADVSQVEDACDDLQHLNLDVIRDPNHLHGFLEKETQKQSEGPSL